MTMGWKEKEESNTLDSLLEVAGWKEGHAEQNGTPWRKGDLAVYRGMGGMEVRGSRHEVIVGSDSFTRVSGDRSLVVNQDMTVQANRMQLAKHQRNPGAVDSLTVHGNLRAKSDDRLTIGTGTVDRMFYGNHAKIAGMEGVICGGAWNRTYATNLSTLSSLFMGDVFGGAVVAAGARVHISTMLYRSAEYSRWRMGSYTRNVTSCIEPLVSPVQQVGKWRRRLDLGQTILFTALPMLGILFAAVVTPILLVWALMKYLYNKAKGRTPAATPTEPRTRTRTVGGTEVAVRTSEVIV